MVVMLMIRNRHWLPGSWYVDQKRGGLGVIRLRLQNDALLMKNLDKFFNKADLPWVKLISSQYCSKWKLPGRAMKGSCWWHSILRILDNYKGIAKADFHSSDTILFWRDLCNGQVLELTYPQFHSYTESDNVSLKLILQLDNIQNHFYLPLSEEAYEQFCDLNVLLLSLQANGQDDGWSYI
jgi:hypothetical protein